ncbi:MAG: TonB-dependent receptor [Planctomycetes bacterium]|nr:TonB-dependent receptor [Planctomycetota bacterium]
MKLSTLQKALSLNLDPRVYGTVAEIGAGQEVARFFFRAGGAAGTIAKTMSAYDMQFSDAIYGESKRFVSKDRLTLMLNREYGLIQERLMSRRGKDTCFFTYSNTVAARGYGEKRPCHGWVGMKFQLEPEEECNEIILHVRLHDITNQQQQDALGVFGINLIYSIYNSWQDPQAMVTQLLDDLGWERLEIDYIHLSGPKFKDVDSRLLLLYLLKIGHTEMAMFSPQGEPELASEALYKKDLLIMRGTFSPPRDKHFSLATESEKHFLGREGGEAGKSKILFEMNLAPGSKEEEDSLDIEEILERIDLFAARGYSVMVSRFYRYFRVREFVSSVTAGRVRFIMGLEHVPQIFDPKYYDGYEGGILAALGHLFTGDTRCYIHYKDKSKGEFSSLLSSGIPDSEKQLLLYLYERDKLIMM